MTAVIFSSVVSLVFLVLAIGVGAVGAFHMKATRRQLDEEFNGYISCPTGKLKQEAERADVKLEREHRRSRSISFNDLSGVH